MCSGSNLGRLAGTTCWIDLLSPTTYYTSVNGRQGVDSQSTETACQTHLITLLIIQNHGVQLPLGSNLERHAGSTCWIDLLSPTTYYTSVNGRQGVDSQSTEIVCQTHLITLLIIQNHGVQMRSGSNLGAL